MKQALPRLMVTTPLIPWIFIVFPVLPEPLARERKGSNVGVS